MTCIGGGLRRMMAVDADDLPQMRMSLYIYMLYCNHDPQSPPTIFYLPSPPPTLYPYSSNWAIIYGYLQSAPAPVMMKVL